MDWVLMMVMGSMLVGGFIIGLWVGSTETHRAWMRDTESLIPRPSSPSSTQGGGSMGREDAECRCQTGVTNINGYDYAKMDYQLTCPRAEHRVIAANR